MRVFLGNDVSVNLPSGFEKMPGDFRGCCSFETKTYIHDKNKKLVTGLHDSRCTLMCFSDLCLKRLLLFRLIYIARFVLHLRVFAFEELNTKLFVNVFLTCMICFDAGPALITVGRFLSRISYLSSYVFLLRHCSFASRKVYISLETLLCSLQLSDQAYVSRARCINSFLLLVGLAPHGSNAVYLLIAAVFILCI